MYNTNIMKVVYVDSTDEEIITLKMRVSARLGSCTIERHDTDRVKRVKTERANKIRYIKEIIEFFYNEVEYLYTVFNNISADDLKNITDSAFKSDPYIITILNKYAPVDIEKYRIFVKVSIPVFLRALEKNGVNDYSAKMNKEVKIFSFFKFMYYNVKKEELKRYFYDGILNVIDHPPIMSISDIFKDDVERLKDTFNNNDYDIIDNKTGKLSPLDIEIMRYTEKTKKFKMIYDEFGISQRI